MYYILSNIDANNCSSEYILEETFDHIERLLDLERTKELQPTETIQVLVYSLKIAV